MSLYRRIQNSVHTRSSAISPSGYDSVFTSVCSFVLTRSYRSRDEEVADCDGESDADCDGESDADCDGESDADCDGESDCSFNCPDQSNESRRYQSDISRSGHNRCYSGRINGRHLLRDKEDVAYATTS